MKIPRRPMFTTIVYGLLAGTSFIPIVMAMSSVMEWTAAFRMAMWLVLAGYLAMLTRWGRVNLLSIVFPLLLLLLLVSAAITNASASVGFKDTVRSTRLSI